MKTTIIVGIIALFVVSSLAPLSFGTNIESTEQSTNDYSRYLYPEYYDCYSVDEIPDYVEQSSMDEYQEYEVSISQDVVTTEKLTQPLGGPMDSPWPMYCHDTRHTGRSPYSSHDNNGANKWKFDTGDMAIGDIVIDDDGNIYIGSTSFYVIYPNGTLKWKYQTFFYIEGAPAIDENGIIYFGTIYGEPSYLYAFYPNGTLKWKYSVGGRSSIFSSPAIDNDGMIYFSYGGDYPPVGYIVSLYPNGTKKWSYKTNHVVYSSPAISEDGTIYCGSHDTYLYALSPNNGTLKWKYKTGDWIRTSPCIGDDGTIYVVSLDRNLHAVNPDGSIKWKTSVGAGTSPTIGQDGTIYAGYKTLYAINPYDGSIIWQIDVDGTMRGGTPCNSIDGTIYVGISEGEEIIAFNSNGNEKWRKSIGDCESAPAIGEDGTVYIGSRGHYLYAFSVGELEADANGPYYGLINEPVQFEGHAEGGNSPYTFHWDFGDTFNSDEQNPQHTYTAPGNYTVTLTVIDDSGNSTDDTTWAWIQDGNSPPSQPDINGPINGNAGTSYPYTFTSNDPEGLHIWYYIDWDDNTNTGWIGPYNSGIIITKSHTWSNQGNYTIKCKAKDIYDDEGPWGELTVSMPRNKETSIGLLYQVLEQFPMLQKLLLFLK